jgi:hypothetical protein
MLARKNRNWPRLLGFLLWKELGHFRGDVGMDACLGPLEKGNILEVSKNSPIRSRVSDITIYIGFLELTWPGSRSGQNLEILHVVLKY